MKTQRLIRLDSNVYTMLFTEQVSRKFFIENIAEYLLQNTQAEPFKYLDKLFKFLAELFKYFTKLFKHLVDHLKPEEKIKNSSKSFKSRLFDRLSVYVITWSLPSQLATIFKGHVSVIFLQLPHCLCFN